MKKLIGLGVVTSLVGVSFVAGVAIGKTGAKEPKFIERAEVKFDDVGGPKLGQLTGDYKKGPYVGLLQLPGGFTSPMHSHTGDYEAVQIEGTSSHWVKGEDGTKAKKMTPGSYWTFPAKLDHVSQCEKGKDCVVLVWQKSKFDFVPGKEDKKPADATKPADKTPAKTEPVKKP